jgi:hypothetical protein
MSLTLHKAQKYLARILPFEAPRVAGLLTMRSTILSYIFIVLPQVILATILPLNPRLHLHPHAARGPCDDNHRSSAAQSPPRNYTARPNSAPVSKPSAKKSWQRRAFRLRLSVVSTAFWCAVGIIVVDLGFRALAAWATLLASLVF